MDGTRQGNHGRLRTKVRVFVGAPGDTWPERRVLRNVVSSLNSNFAEWSGLTVELIEYTTHTSPDAGRPEQVILDQVPPDDWDIFIGILWLRFGTPSGEINPDT